MNIMQKAHQWARSRRSEFDSYKAALSAGLKLAHAEAKAAREEPTPQVEPEATTKGKILYQAREVPADRAAAIIAQGVEKYRNQIRPFLLQDWKSPDYNGKEMFRRGLWR